MHCLVAEGLAHAEGRREGLHAMMNAVDRLIASMPDVFSVIDRRLSIMTMDFMRRENKKHLEHTLLPQLKFQSGHRLKFHPLDLEMQFGVVPEFSDASMYIANTRATIINCVRITC